MTNCFKKAISLISASVFAVTALAGCKDDTDSSAEAVNDRPYYTAEEYYTGEEKVTVDGTSFMVSDKELWINGVNTPWQNWNDFGGSFDESFWDEHFAGLHEIGINASRVWINCNGTIAINLSKEGVVTEVTELHWEHLDKLFSIAAKHDIYIMATLLSFDHFKDTNSGYMFWRRMLASEEGTQSFIDLYLKEFLERYADNPYLWCIDLMNEPDWVHEEEKNGQIEWDVLSAFFAKCSAYIHENSDVLVTVGMGMIKYNSDKYEGNFVSDEYLMERGGENAYLDFYSPHFYDWMRQWMGEPFTVSPTEYGLDGTKPAMLGEIPADGGEKGVLSEQYESCYLNGWNGAMGWTSNAMNGYDHWEHIKQASEKMMEIAADKIFPLGKS